MSAAKKRVQIEEVEDDEKVVKTKPSDEPSDEVKALQKQLDDAAKEYNDAVKECEAKSAKLNDLREEVLLAERKKCQKLLDLSNLRLTVLSNQNMALQNRVSELEKTKA